MLSFLPTPIGNLEDITYRTVKLLQGSEVVLCEDTRVAKRLITLLNDKLSTNINIQQKKFISLHSHNEQSIIDRLDDKFFEQDIVYMSDAGTPAISDPGAMLVKYCQKHHIKYQVLPGASASIVAVAASGFDIERFLFVGFLPHKHTARKAQLQTILEDGFVSILYESPKRVLDLLEIIHSLNPTVEVFVAKELSKLHEQFFVGKAGEVLEILKKRSIKGEWVVVIDGATKSTGEPITIDDISSLSLPPKQKAKLLAKLTSRPIKDIYDDLNEL